MDEKIYANLGIIVAVGEQREIGYRNDLIWKIKEDLSYFKKVTIGSFIIMGRNTYNSMPKSLNGRTYIVLSSKPDFCLESPNIVTRSVDETLHFVKINPNEKFFVVGGGSIYSIFLPYVSKMYITEILDTMPLADVYFPNYDKKEWEEEQITYHQEEGLEYKRLVLQRKDKK